MAGNLISNHNRPIINDKPAICRMWSSARCQAQGGTLAIAFRLGRLQKFRYDVPPFQKLLVGVPVRSGSV